MGQSYMFKKNIIDQPYALTEWSSIALLISIFTHLAKKNYQVDSKIKDIG